MKGRASRLSNYKFEGVSRFAAAQNNNRDTETGNDAHFASRMGLRDNIGARYYRSALGRWLSAAERAPRSPARGAWEIGTWSVPAPVPYANLTNPQTLNLYAMVSDNPETFADLDGHLGQNGPYNLETGENAGTSRQPNCDYVGGKCQHANTNVNGHDKDKVQKAAQQKNQNDPLQESLMAAQQRRQQAIDQAIGPTVGSPEYVQKLTAQTAALDTSGEKQILVPAAIIEGLAVSTIVATSATATTVVEVSVNVASKVNATYYRVGVTAGAAIDTYVKGGVEGVHDFVEGALEPAKAPPSAAGILGGAARTAYDLVKDVVQ